MADGEIRRSEVRRVVRRTSDFYYGPEQAAFKGKDAWRVLRIMGEFVERFEELADLGPAVTIFGSARISHENPMYGAATGVGRLLGEAGFTIITGRGPGAMEAGNRGRGRPGRLRWS
jgi:hypothetical protein